MLTPTGTGWSLPVESIPDHVRPVVVEPHPVYQGFVLDEPEQARAGVSGLWFGGYPSDFDVAEPERREGTRYLRVLVEARGDADRVPKRLSERVDAEPGVDDSVVVGDSAFYRGVLHCPERTVPETVRRFGVEFESERLEEVVRCHCPSRAGESG